MFTQPRAFWAGLEGRLLNAACRLFVRFRRASLKGDGRELHEHSGLVNRSLDGALGVLVGAGGRLSFARLQHKATFTPCSASVFEPDPVGAGTGPSLAGHRPKAAKLKIQFVHPRLE